MKKIINITGFSALTLAILLALYLSGVYTTIARAAVAYFNPSNCYTAAATTSLAYMTVGNSTSTVTCVLGPEGARSAVISVEATASSTASQYTFGVEESMDGIDWFPVRYGINASTSAAIAATSDGLINYTFASSTTLGGVGALEGSASSTARTGNNRNHFVLDIPVRMKRIRVWTGITGANGAVWLQIIPRQDVN